jgi:hypothetical protein
MKAKFLLTLGVGIVAIVAVLGAAIYLSYLLLRATVRWLRAAL